MRNIKKLLLWLLPDAVISKLGQYKHVIEASKASSHSFHMFVSYLLNYWIYGVDPEEYRCFHFKRLCHAEKKKFITHDKGIEIDKKVNDKEANNVLNEKHLFNEYFAQYIHRKWIRIDGNSTSESEIKSFFEDLGGRSYIVKPDDMYYGLGIHKGVTLEELYELRKDGKKYIVEEMLENHEDLAKINESSLNTMRVVTFIDKFGNPNILAMALRAGVKGAVVDNAYSGGVSYHVNQLLGFIDSKGVDVNGGEYTFHPSNHTFMLGYKVPMFKDVENLCVNLAQNIPSARYVGWDIAITNRGVEVIEGNICPSAAVTQCDGVGIYEKIKRLM